MTTATMSTVTLSTTTTSILAPLSAGPDAVRPRPGIWRRLLDRMIEGRMRKAEEIIRQNRHLLPRELEDSAGWKLTERSEDSLPFLR